MARESMETIETKVKIDKELMEKVKEYNINIEAFIDTGFRKYVDYIVYKNKLNEHRNEIDTSFFPKDKDKEELKESIERVKIQDINELSIDLTKDEMIKSNELKTNLIMDIIEKLCLNTREGNAASEDIFDEAWVYKIEINEVKDIIGKLKRNGKIYESSSNKYRLSDLKI
jgi:hypothetical protein